MASKEDRDVQFKNQANVTKLAEGNLEFAFDLYQAILKDNFDTNLFFSPFSVTVALAMTYAGARSNTAHQMRSSMKLDDVDDVHSAIEDILVSLNLGKGTERNLRFVLHCANQMYVQKDYSITDSYVGTLTDHYETQPEKVDFRRNAEETRQRINKWVEEVTRDKIKELIAPDMINAMTHMVLVNAIYFKGNWSRQFDPKKTIEEEFFVNNEDKTRVEMMYMMKEKFHYAENKELKCKILELPYDGDRLVMYVILPEETEGLSLLEKQLTPSVFNDLRSMATMRRSQVRVGIPKFRLESTVQLDDTLQTMGMRDLFAPGDADLGGITGNRDLHVSAVIHKAFVEVNEEGTEAAAATAVIMLRYAAVVNVPLEFIANRPFLFLIYDKHTDLVLFLGRLKRPE